MRTKYKVVEIYRCGHIRRWAVVDCSMFDYRKNDRYIPIVGRYYGAEGAAHLFLKELREKAI